MRSKKLLTLACVVGILAFGACIYIPSGPAPPPAPPRPVFAGIQMIEVVVTNTSESHHLDPAELAAAVVKEINDRTKYTTMRAEVQKDGAAGDAVLKITVLNETADPARRQNSPTGRIEGWRFHFTVSSTLTRTDGTIAWGETAGAYPVFRDTRKDLQDAWNDQKMRRSITSEVSGGFVARMFYRR